MTMKIKIFISLFLTFAITGCQKQQDEAAASEPDKIDITAKVQFEQSDKKIGAFLDQLENPDTLQDVRTQILCKDYPGEYKKNYMPALLKLSPADFTEKKLLLDLDSSLDYYKKSFGVNC